MSDPKQSAARRAIAPMRSAIVAVAVLLLAAGTGSAQTLSDPTAPLLPPAARRAAAEQPAWQLQSTVIAPQRRVAVINGSVATIGDQVDGARVVAIAHGSAELDVDGRRVSLTLFGTAPDIEQPRGTR